MNCPKCKSPDFIVLTERVDIGVGTLEHILGGDCKECGHISICDVCEAWEGQDCNLEMHIMFNAGYDDSIPPFTVEVG